MKDNAGYKWISPVSLGHLPPRHDPDAATKRAIWSATEIERKGMKRVTLRYANGTFISFVPMDEKFRDDVDGRVRQLWAMNGKGLVNNR